MFKKIENEMNEFVGGIKESKGCDELLVYMNSSYVSSIKLLMFASSTISLYGRLMMFFIMASAGLLMSSVIGAIPLPITPFLVLTLLLFALILVLTSHFRTQLSTCIKNTKSIMESSENSIDEEK